MNTIGTGSIVQREKGKPRSRCRTWELSVVVRDDTGGKRRRTRTFHGTWSQAQDALEAFRGELESTPVTSDMAFSEWCEVWKSRRVSAMRYSQSTLENDRRRLAAAMMHITCPVGDVTADMVRSLYGKLAAGESPSGRPWMPKSVEGLHKTLTTLFSDAARSGVIARSPMEAVQCPKVPRRRYTVLSSAQMDELLASLDYSDGAQRAVALCCACGLRRREAVELEWADFGDSATVVDSKTAAGSRSVPVPSAVREAIEAHRERSGRVSGMTDPHSLSRWWTRNRERLGCDCTLHDLRRSWATRLAAAGVHPRVMMELGGWDSIDVAMEVYTQVSGAQREEAVRAAFG